MTLLTDIHQLVQLDGLRSAQPSAQWPQEIEERIAMSHELAGWAPGLVVRIKGALSRQLQESADANPAQRKLTPQQRKDVDAWKRHCQAGHLPHRRDCAVCLEGAGKDRPRRRQACPERYCLGIDLTGPFKPGKDQVVRQARYAIDEGVSLAQGLKDLRGEVKILEGDEDVLQAIGAEDPEPPQGREWIEEVAKSTLWRTRTFVTLKLTRASGRAS